MIAIKVRCKTCGNEFRWYPNSTIKPKLCRVCTNRKLLERSQIKSKSVSVKKTTKISVHGDRAVKNDRNASKKNLMDRADMWFSRFIRINNLYTISQNEPIAKCYTCGKISASRYLECGHWQRRGYKSIRYDPNNARPQCKKCNYYRSGVPEVFEINLIKEIGEDKVLELKSKAQEDFRDSIEFYRQQSDKYRELTNQLVKELEINKWW